MEPSFPPPIRNGRSIVGRRLGFLGLINWFLIPLLGYMALRARYVPAFRHVESVSVFRYQSQGKEAVAIYNRKVFRGALDVLKKPNIPCKGARSEGLGD